MEKQKRLDQKAVLSVVIEVKHPISCELSGFEGQRKTRVFISFCKSKKPVGKH